jgi:hypothetical protein
MCCNHRHAAAAELTHKERCRGCRISPARDPQARFAATDSLDGGSQAVRTACGTSPISPTASRPTYATASGESDSRDLARFARLAVAADHYLAHTPLVGGLTSVEQDEAVAVLSGGLRRDLNHVRDRRSTLANSSLIGTSMRRSARGTRSGLPGAHRYDRASGGSSWRQMTLASLRSSARTKSRYSAAAARSLPLPGGCGPLVGSLAASQPDTNAATNVSAIQRRTSNTADSTTRGTQGRPLSATDRAAPCAVVNAGLSLCAICESAGGGTRGAGSSSGASAWPNCWGRSHPWETERGVPYRH